MIKLIFNILKNSIVNIWPSLVIILVTIISIRFAYLKINKIKFDFYKEFWTLFSVFYLLLLYELVTRVDYNTLGGGINITPFAEIMRYKITSEYFLLNVIGNIALFIPFGYIISKYIKPKNILYILLIALCVSTTTEIVQLNIGRSFDIDDILLNTIGCTIGYILYLIFNYLYKYLPNIFKSKLFNNLLCLIILVIIVICIFVGVLR